MLEFQVLFKLEFPILSPHSPSAGLFSAPTRGRSRFASRGIADLRPGKSPRLHPGIMETRRESLRESRGAVSGGRLKAEICGTAGGMQGISKGRLGCRWKREQAQGPRCTGAYGKSCKQGGHFICFRSITSSRYLWIFYLFSASGLQIEAPGALVRLKANK